MVLSVTYLKMIAPTNIPSKKMITTVVNTKVYSAARLTEYSDTWLMWLITLLLLNLLRMLCWLALVSVCALLSSSPLGVVMASLVSVLDLFSLGSWVISPLSMVFVLFSMLNEIDLVKQPGWLIFSWKCFAIGSIIFAFTE